MNNVAEADQLIKKLNGHWFEGRRIFLDIVK